VGRMGAAVIGMELAALVVAVLAFGWPVLLVGVPLFVGTVIALAVVRLWETARRHLERRRAARFDPAATLPSGLMSGFFEVAAVPDRPAMPPVDVPILRAARERRQGRPTGLARGPAAAALVCRPVQRVLALSEWLPRPVRPRRGPRR
jgi:hypothetical protein